MDEHYGQMYEDHEWRKLVDDPAFQVALDFGGHFFRALIGDRQGGFRAWRRTRTFDAAIKWLQIQAQVLYPESQYASALVDEIPPTCSMPGYLLGDGLGGFADTSEQHVLTHV
jgi:hypothetical protein